jgi:hypothetical protein
MRILIASDRRRGRRPIAARRGDESTAGAVMTPDAGFGGPSCLMNIHAGAPNGA